MHPAVELVLNHDPDDHGSLADRVASLADEFRLWELMSHYNWDEGFEVPLAVIRHPRCDRALALRLFWDLDDAAREYLVGGTTDFGASYAPYDAEEAARVEEYCRILTEGLRHGRFPPGRNSFDTGFFGTDDPTLTERQRKLRAGKTTLAQRDYDDAFLHPAVAVA
ncbi:DUF4274 domain-containing protein [Rhodococcus sp. SJ-3]|uniref:DUF4274 domain-containing protein n=1 Tax=Rhodococcus sp. SJ-3 TaxID=3454628 RepID=UPI003F79711C